MFAFMTGLGQGAVAGEQERRRRKREDAQDERIRIRDARETELYEREKKRHDEADQLETQMKAAGASVTPQDGTVYQPAIYDDGNAMPPNPTAGTSVAGGRRFATMGEAQAHATAQNTPVARMRRQADVLGGAGKVQDMVNLQDAVKRLEKEGHLQFIDTQAPKVPTAEQIKAGQAQFDLDPAAVQAFNAAGGGTIPPGAYGVAKVLKMPNGREVVDFAVVGADGKMLAPSARQIEQVYGFSRAEREGRADTQHSQGATIKHQEATLKESARGHDLSAQTQLRIAQMRETGANARNAANVWPAPIWDDKADAFLKDRYTSKNPDTGQVVVDGDGLMFAKTIAFAAAQQKFGGDTTRALGYAFEIDNQIKDRVKGDQAKVRDERKKLLGALMGEQADTPPPPTPAPAPKVATMPPARAAQTEPARQAPILLPEQLLSLTQQAGQTLQSATQARVLAEQTRLSYGSRQKLDDPRGFNKAELAYNLALQQEKAAKEAYQQLVQQSRAIDPAAAANVYAKP